MKYKIYFIFRGRQKGQKYKITVVISIIPLASQIKIICEANGIILV